MRRALLLALLFVACGPGDGGRGTASASATTSSTTATTDATSTSSTTDATSTSSTAATSSTSAADTTGALTSSTTTADTTGGADPSTSTTSTGTTGPDLPTCPPVGELDCTPGPGSGEADTCFDAPSCFLKTVQAAIKAVLAAHPEWFMHDDKGDYVLEVELYMDAVVAVVAETPLCAIRDPNAGDEIAVKHDNAYSENFDILTADGYVRAGDGIFTGTCAPAWF